MRSELHTMWNAREKNHPDLTYPIETSHRWRSEVEENKNKTGPGFNNS